MLDVIREQLKITKVDLAKGIVSERNIGRILRGHQTPHLFIFQALLERLGTNYRKFFPTVAEDGDALFFVLRQQINQLIANEDVPAIQEKLALLQNDPLFVTDKWRQQYFHMCEAFLGYITHADVEIIRRHLDKAIRFTIPHFQEEKADTCLLSHEEFEIIHMMGLLYENEGNREKAIALLEKLVQNARSNTYDKHEKARSLTLAIYSLSKCLGKSGRREEALAVCDEAIQAGREGGVYGVLPRILYNKAYSYAELGQMDKAEPLLYEAYYGCLMIGDTSTAASILLNANDHWGIKIVAPGAATL